MLQIGSDPSGVAIMVPKGVFRAIKISGLSPKAANIIKQELLAKGGEAAVNRGVIVHSVDESDVLLMGTLRQYEQVIRKLQAQPFGLARIAEEIRGALANYEHREPFQLKCGDKVLNIGERTLIMGILNVTPDSFSDGGRFNNLKVAVEHAREMVEQGADIIDIGAESTRPGYTPLSLEEEMDRLMPVLQELVREIPAPISVDTYKAEVARRTLDAGANLINDIWALQADQQMASTVARYDVPVILMHNRHHTEYNDLIGEILKHLRGSIKLAEQAGVRPSQIIVDPGIGFGKTTAQNLEVMRRLPEFHVLGKPVLLGTSRKSLIGNTLNLPVHERLEGTAATVTLGITRGVDIIRVHDIKEMVRVVRMTDAMIRG